MSERNYIYLFPDIKSIDFISVLSFISKMLNELYFEISMVEIDEHGDYEETGHIDTYNLTEIYKLIKNEKMFYLTLNAKDIFFNILFACSGFNPHISISWVKNLFNKINFKQKEEYYNNLKEIMIISKVGYILFAEEGFQNFENNFIIVDGFRILDNKFYYDATEFNPVKYLWISPSSKEPYGVDLLYYKKLDNNFVCYKVK